MQEDLGYEIPQFMTEINTIQSDPQPEYIPNFDAWQLDYFYKSINNFNAMSDHDMHNFVKCNIDFIAKQFNDGTCKYARKLCDMDFLRVLYDVLNNMPITESRKLFVNKLCYSYQYYKSASYEALHNMLKITKIANRRKVDELLSIGLDEDTATYCCMCRYSSSDEYQNAVRLNFYLCTRGVSVMSEQMIIYIYEKLFDQIRYLFLATMLDYDPKQHGIDPTNQFEEQDANDVFNNITLAILTIVNNMTSDDIYRLIKIFLDAWNAYHRPPVRFSLRALSGDFGRIRDVVDRMYDQNNIYIP